MEIFLKFGAIEGGELKFHCNFGNVISGNGKGNEKFDV